MSLLRPGPLQIEYYSPHELRPDPNNAKVHTKGQIKKIAKSIKRLGFISPALISDQMDIIVGHARIEAAKQIGLKRIPAIRLSNLKPSERLAYSLADNRLAEFGKYDRGLLAIQLQELTTLGFDEIELTGFSLSDLDVHLDEAPEQKPEFSEDELPAPAKSPVSRQGDVWILGPHRLFCSNATAAADCQRLLQRGAPADMVFTDPLWNVPNKHSSTRDRHPQATIAKLHHESEAKNIAFFAALLRLVKEASKPGATMFVSIDSWCYFDLLTAAHAEQLVMKDLVVWAKPNPEAGEFYRTQHELIAVMASGDAALPNRLELDQHGRRRSNLWQYRNPVGARRAEQGTGSAGKPVALIADAISDVSRRGAIVLDPFAGVGSTLIAAEKTGRKALAFESDPLNCDIIIRRFEAYTGKLAQLDGEASTFEQAGRARVGDRRGSEQHRPLERGKQ